MKRVLYVGGFLWILLSLSVAGGCADKHEECVRAVFQENTALQRKWQESLQKMIIRNRPELEIPATVSRDLQTALVEKRAKEFDFLLANHPGAIEVRGGFALFKNFNVTEENARELKAKDPEYVKLESNIESLIQQFKSLPEWDAYRTYFAEELTKQPEFRGLIGELAAEGKKVEEHYIECRKLVGPLEKKK